MSDSDPAFRAITTKSGEVRDAVLATELRVMKEQLGSINAFTSEMRSFMAEQRALAAVRQEAEARFRGEDWPEMKARVAKVEERINALEGFRWKIVGAITASGAVGGIVAALVNFAMAVFGR